MTNKKEKIIGACYYMLCIFIGKLPFHTVRISLLRLLKANIGKGVGLYRNFEVRRPSKLTIGHSTVIGHNVLLDARMGLTIGNNVNLSNDVMLWTLQHDYNSVDFATAGKPIVIEDNVWLCARSIILPGVTVGKGAVIAAGAVVARDVLPYTVMGGVPAKKIADRNRHLDYDLADAILPII